MLNFSSLYKHICLSLKKYKQPINYKIKLSLWKNNAILAHYYIKAPVKYTKKRKNQ